MDRTSACISGCLGKLPAGWFRLLAPLDATLVAQRIGLSVLGSRASESALQDRCGEVELLRLRFNGEISLGFIERSAANRLIVSTMSHFGAIEN